MPEIDISKEIRRLVRTIHRVLALSTNGWATWDRVAKWQTGSTAAAPMLASYACLPEWRHLFATNGTWVKLTQDGLQFVRVLPPEEPTLPEFMADAVVQYAHGLKPIVLKVVRASTVAPAGSRVVQALEVEMTEDLLPSDTPVRVCPQGGKATQGKIVGQEPDGGILYVALDSELLPTELPATLLIDRAYLLTQLAEQLRNLQEFPERMQAAFRKSVGVPLVADDNSMIVAEQLAKLEIPWTRFLWGPPGAGKTFGLGHLVTCLLKAEPQKRILIVAPSNRAVDVAVGHLRTRLYVSSMGNLIAGRKVLRFGYPRKTDIIELPELLGPANLDGLNNVVKELSRRIAKAEQEHLDDSAIAVLRAELLAAQEAVKNAVHQHVRQCSVVATTTTLAYMPTSPVATLEWDTVIIDEVTMVPPAICAFLASKAKDRLLLAGDPRQLGPVYEEHGSTDEKTHFWLGRDVFEVGGVSSGSMEDRHIKTDDARLGRITTQRRCASDIWNRVKHLYPDVNNAVNVDRLKNLAALPPSPGEPVVLLDTSGSTAKCELSRGSWQNRFTAECAMEVAGTIASEASGGFTIAIIAPYRAQVRLLRRWIREERKADTTPFKRIEVEAGTVHQFQGSEADIVIFDMVDGPGRDSLGKLLREDAGIRLVNVAITRARGKLIVIANMDWCRRARLDHNNGLLGQLILGQPMVKQVAVAPAPQRSGDTGPEPDGTESPIERALLEAMREHPSLAGVKVQHEIRGDEGGFVSRADFAFPDIKYAVYCDGRQWHLREDRWQRDLRQRNALTAIGWAFSVFTGSEITRNVDGCATQVLKTHQGRSQQ